MKHSLLFISSEKFVSETATDSLWGQFWKKGVPKI